MDEMSILEAIQKAQVERAKVKDNLSEDTVASSLIEGQQEGVAEERAMKVAERARQVEELGQEVERLRQEAEIIQFIIKNKETDLSHQGRIDANPKGPGAALYREGIDLRKKETAGLIVRLQETAPDFKTDMSMEELKALLQTKKEELDATTVVRDSLKNQEE